MRKLLAVTVLASFALPALADEDQAREARLGELETLVVTALKDEPEQTAESRLRRMEELVITAAKEQPASHEVDKKTADLLAEINAEE